jgi:hypothetical protein
MKIHALNLSCDRDRDLSTLMVDTLYRHCEALTELVVINTDHNNDFKGYENGAGWKATMMKLNQMRKFHIEDNDFFLSVDSDMVFGSSDVFLQVDPLYGIIGIKHKPEYHTHFGGWSHMSGCMIFIRGDVFKKIIALLENELNNIRYQHFKAYAITENEDVILSYLARYVGANYKELPGFLTSGNFESDVTNDELRSFYHLNYCPTSFMGEDVTGKWMIPNVLDRKGIKL